MITVKFFGLLNVDYNMKQMSVQADMLKNVLDAILLAYPQVTKKQLLQSLLFINRVQVPVRANINKKLCDGDEIVFISPSAGG